MKISLAYIIFYFVYVAAVVLFIVACLLTNPSIRQSFFYGPDNYDIMEHVPVGWMSIFALFAGSLIMLIVRGKRLFTKDLTRVNGKIRVLDLLKMTGIILGINAAITLVSYIFSLLLRNMGYTPGPDVFETLYSDFSGLLYVVILGPILEEIIFRGAILRSLERFGQNFAIVVSSLMFGLYHLALFQGVFAFFIGLILAYCAIKFSIKWAMLLHMINNGFAMSFMLIPDGMNIDLGILLLILALGVLAAFVAFKTFRAQLKAGKPTELHFAAGVPIVPCALSPADPRIAHYLTTAMTLRAKPYHLVFSSAWFIVALSLMSILTLVTTFVM